VGCDPPRPSGGSPVLSRLRRAPVYLRSRARRAANRTLDLLETATSSGGEAPLSRPPLLVVGAPRTGSTLLYQLLVQAFDVTYLSNRHCRWYGAPSFVERLRRTAPNASYESRYGATGGVDAPSECGPYWYRFFRRSPQYVPLAETNAAQLRRVRAAVRALTDAHGRPVVFKNLMCSLRLEPIGAALPEALFVVIHRDLVATASSLLAGRKAIFGDYGHWWSAEPPEIDELRSLPPEQQVVEQVRRIEALIERDRERLGGKRFLELRYEELCADPDASLDAVAGLVERNGSRLTRRRQVEAKFDPSDPASLPPELHERLVDYVARG
jgi:LPS sulfotransferase NodH